jgi:hypothetical protein
MSKNEDDEVPKRSGTLVGASTPAEAIGDGPADRGVGANTLAAPSAELAASQRVEAQQQQLKAANTSNPVCRRFAQARARLRASARASASFAKCLAVAPPLAPGCSASRAG